MTGTFDGSKTKFMLFSSKFHWFVEAEAVELIAHRLWMQRDNGVNEYLVVPT